jgi:hypothetical protein
MRSEGERVGKRRSEGGGERGVVRIRGEGVIYLRPVGQFGLTELMGWLDQFGFAEFLVKTHDKDICFKKYFKCI